MSGPSFILSPLSELSPRIALITQLSFDSVLKLRAGYPKVTI